MTQLGLEKNEIRHLLGDCHLVVKFWTKCLTYLYWTPLWINGNWHGIWTELQRIAIGSSGPSNSCGTIWKKNIMSCNFHLFITDSFIYVDVQNLRGGGCKVLICVETPLFQELRGNVNGQIVKNPYSAIVNLLTLNS